MTRRNTRQRILEGSLALFNEFGEPNVTTNHIADELDISPGNLHYHFKRKKDIVEQLFEQYRVAIQPLIDSPPDRAPELEDFWFYLHIIFESIGHYRFLYRDLNDLLGRYPKLLRPFRQLLARKRTTALTICKQLAAVGVVQADPVELESLADHIVLIMVYWLPFSEVAGAEESDNGAELSRAVYQVFSLILPHLREPERSQTRLLAISYLAH